MRIENRDGRGSFGKRIWCRWEEYMTETDRINICGQMVECDMCGFFNFTVQ